MRRGRPTVLALGLGVAGLLGARSLVGFEFAPHRIRHATSFVTPQ